MSRPGTFERVYAAIKDQLRRGVFRPGERIEPALLSDQLNASVTPVRDALHRLTGERIIEAPRHEGFRVPLLTEAVLRQLYAWHRDLVALAIASRAHQDLQSASSIETEHDAAFERQNQLFIALAQRTGNLEHVLALENLIARLEPVQRLEPALLDALDEETDAILDALRTGDKPALRRSLQHYHRRRARIVPALIEKLYSA